MATQSEQAEKWIEKYTDIQRALAAPDMKGELDYQLSIAKANLAALGIPTESLDLKHQ